MARKNGIEIKEGSNRIDKRESHIRVLKMGLLTTSVFLIIIYFLLNLFYNHGAFTVVLNQEFARKSGIIMYESLATKDVRSI